jgi:dimethylamine/trimethylamine dehydrogenase
MVTARRPNDDLYRKLSEQMAAVVEVEGTPKSLRRIGDCEAPAIIAAAVHAGHRYARELDTSQCGHPPIKRDRAVIP